MIYLLLLLKTTSLELVGTVLKFHLAILLPYGDAFGWFCWIQTGMSNLSPPKRCSLRGCTRPDPLIRTAGLEAGGGGGGGRTSVSMSGARMASSSRGWAMRRALGGRGGLRAEGAGLGHQPLEAFLNGVGLHAVGPQSLLGLQSGSQGFFFWKERHNIKFAYWSKSNTILN
ncbi:hypothetical protein CEXT_383861 [Caerostris extrusa]|uniref:Uncharacterized protein n=1 Tax=Caerostris extrusa TaxID=172846 RepID=A0AAV4UIT3_CAEEX|nr:hypothetical protein CEXT_383861 [Caerostris extrusa]